jgi:DNA-binding NarL/FixJ family response regulator
MERMELHQFSNPEETCDTLASLRSPLSGKIRIMLVDDHALMREGLARLLGQEPDFDVVGQVSDGQEAFEKAASLLPQVVLMDISMPRMSGIDATKIIHQRHPDTRVIGLSLYPEEERAKQMLDAGATFYFTKSGPPADLKAAIRACVEKQEADGAEEHSDSQRMKN